MAGGISGSGCAGARAPASGQMHQLFAEGLCGSEAGPREHTISEENVSLCFVTRVGLGFPSFFWDVNAEYPHLLAAVMLS